MENEKKDMWWEGDTSLRLTLDTAWEFGMISAGGLSELKRKGYKIMIVSPEFVQDWTLTQLTLYADRTGPIREQEGEDWMDALEALNVDLKESKKKLEELGFRILTDHEEYPPYKDSNETGWFIN